MPSSISNFEVESGHGVHPSRSYSKGIVALVAVLTALLVSAEFGARAFDRISRIQRRTITERTGLAGITSGTGSTLLLVGNSIVLEGVDFPLFQQATSTSGIRSYRYIVEQTGYLDWYYGLSRLFKEGIRPTYLLIGFPAPHLNGSTMRGDYSAQYLFDLKGVLEYSARTDLDRTSASSLVFSHYSRFFALRSSIRAYLLNRIFPAYSDVLHNLTMVRAVPDTDEHIYSTARERLQALDRLCRDYGVKLIFMVMPTGQQGEGPVLSAGRSVEVATLMPVPNKQLSPDDFADGFHLNAKGSSIFTNALIRALPAVTRLP